jgi:hypothetical protein
MMIARKDEHENASDSIRFNLQLFSNETHESDLQAEKHDAQRTSTCRGIVIDLSGHDEKAKTSIRLNSQSLQNEIEESRAQ